MKKLLSILSAALLVALVLSGPIAQPALATDPCSSAQGDPFPPGGGPAHPFRGRWGTAEIAVPLRPPPHPQPPPNHPQGREGGADSPPTRPADLPSGRDDVGERRGPRGRGALRRLGGSLRRRHLLAVVGTVA